MEKMKLSFKRDVTYGYSWPQKNFTCSFCKREYKSPQALGGHMNVHRRDRAKLMRELSPSLYGLNSNMNHNHNHNPSPNPTFPSPSNNSIDVSSYTNPSPNISSSSTSKPAQYFSYGMPLIPFVGASSDQDGKNYLKKKREDEFFVLKKRKNCLNMNEGVKLIQEDKQELDLELRLG